MNKRYLGAAILAPFVIFLFIGGICLKYLILILSLMGLYEFYKIVEEKSIHPFKVLGYVFTIIYYVGLGVIFNNNLLLYMIGGLTLISLCIPVINTKYNFVDSAITIMGFIYVPIFFSFITLCENLQYGNFLVWLIFISSWLGDTSAYYFGRFFGKRKLCPKVSPKKTIAGAIGGLLGSMIGCTIFGVIITQYGVNIALYHYIIIGFLGSVLGIFGDLTASSIKRNTGVKDFSNIIPGHGGILDRFDSILFTSFLVYYYISLIMG